MKLSADRTAEAMMIAGAVFYMYWFFVEPNNTGMALAVGTLLGGASFQYRPDPKPLGLALAFAAVLLAIHAWRGNPLAYGGGYLVGAGLPWLAYRLFDAKKR